VGGGVKANKKMVKIENFPKAIDSGKSHKCLGI